jgi:hypothetical protein
LPNKNPAVFFPAPQQLLLPAATCFSATTFAPHRQLFSPPATFAPRPTFGSLRECGFPLVLRGFPLENSRKKKGETLFIFLKKCLLLGVSNFANSLLPKNVHVNANPRAPQESREHQTGQAFLRTPAKIKIWRAHFGFFC